MDVRTISQLLLRDLHQDALTANNQKTLDSIMRSIAESLRYNRTYKTYFNVKSSVIELTDGITEYPLPADFLGLIGEVMWVETLTSEVQIPLIDAGMDFVLKLRPSDYLVNSEDSVSVTNIPTSENHRFFAVDIPGKKIYTAKQTGYLKIRYLADLGTITYKHDGSNWVFYEPNTSTATSTTSTYTNPWFTEGFDALKTRAEYYLWSRELGGTETALQKANIALGQWSEALTKIQEETTLRKSNRRVRPWI